jgi:diguanylate cyclase (GGDEF)-like protein
MLAIDQLPHRGSTLIAVPVATTATGTVLLTARWPQPGPPNASQSECLELCAAQAGASLRNAQAHRELEALKDELAHEAAHDPLTGLANPRRFHERLERVCGRGAPDEMIAVLFLDLDGMKLVNDQYGHHVGDQLLIGIATRLANCARFGDLVARMGGDEFTILLTRLTSVGPAYDVAERIGEVLREPLIVEGRSVQISSSIGIAVAPANEADPGDLVRRADVAMYRAKRQGKAGWVMDPTFLEPSTEAS